MLRYILLIIVLFGLMACSSENESYYRKNPEALQSALQNCPEKSPLGINCEQLKTIGKRVNELAYQLQRNPQGFGKKILNLQMNLAAQYQQLANEQNTQHQEIRNKIQLTQEDLREHFVIVKWLESPK